VAPAARQRGPIKRPLERAPPRSRAHAPLERIPPRSRLPHERTCSRTRVRAFNALTQQSCAITRLGITPWRCFANSLGEAHPRHCGGCATRPASAPCYCAAHSCTANAPRPRRGDGRTLEPSSRDSAGSDRDVRPARPPSPSLSVLCGHPRPCSPMSCTAATTPTLLSTRGRDAATPATVPHTDHRHGFLEPAWRRPGQPLRLHPRSHLCSSTGHATTP
jgi:hypothetical protein